MRLGNKSFKTVSSALSIIIFLIVLCQFFPATAYDNSLIENDFQWKEISQTNLISADKLEGSVSYITDNENGCFYLHFHFFDIRLKEMKKENVNINFKIINSENAYAFSVNCNGIMYAKSDNIDNKLDIHQNFDKMKMKGGAGELFIGIELKNKEDKSLKNYISAACYYGDNNVAQLIENTELDMYIPTTTNQKSTKSVTEKPAASNTTDKSVSEKADSQNTKTGVKAEEKKSTKFTPSKYTDKVKKTEGKNKKATEKYVPKASAKIQERVSETAKNKSSEAAQTEVAEDVTVQAVSEAKVTYSKPAKLMILVSSTIAAVGAALILSAIFSKYKIVKADENGEN